MKTVRLLPVVILASCSLLVFKSVGLLTNGAYVLTGTTTAQAADPTGGDATAAAADGAMDVDSPPTLADTNPTLADSAPTIGQQTDGGHGAVVPASPPAAPEAQESAPAGQGAAAAVSQASLPAIEAGGTDAAASDCAPTGDAMSDAPETACPPSISEEEATASQGPLLTEQAVLERLSERRAALEVLEAELALRTSLIEAAEKRLDERATALEALEARIAAMVDEKKALETEQFKAVVAMYENMKPAEAAVILNSLDIEVLLKVAQTMSPRKMSPILARMTPQVAQDLTVRLASADEQPAAPEETGDLAELPQIVGQ